MPRSMLLVEDALDLARVGQRALETEGYAVLHASSGRHALALYEREQSWCIF